MTRVITLTTMLDAVTSVFAGMLIVTVDLTSSSQRTLRSTAASHQKRAAPGTGNGVRMSAGKVGRCPCPRPVTTVTAASGVITHIKTVRSSVTSLITPAHTPVYPCVMTCAGA